MAKTTRFNHTVSLEKKAEASIGRRGRHLNTIATLLRAVEVLLFMALISRIALALPLNYVHQFAVTVINTPVVFVVANAIVITLILRSIQPINPPDPEPETTFILRVYSSPPGKKVGGRGNSATAAEVKIDCYRRTKSERMCGEGSGVLRRTKTAAERGGQFGEENMNGAEFRRTVEDFIARQQRLLREEEEAGQHRIP